MHEPMDAFTNMKSHLSRKYLRHQSAVIWDIEVAVRKGESVNMGAYWYVFPRGPLLVEHVYFVFLAGVIGLQGPTFCYDTCARSYEP